MAVQVAERVVIQDHDINECVNRVKASPIAARHLLAEVVRLIHGRTLVNDPKWERASERQKPSGWPYTKSAFLVGSADSSRPLTDTLTGRITFRVALPADARALYDVEGAAAYLNIPARWVADAVRDGKIRHQRFGKHIRFTQEHAGEFIAACEQPFTVQVVSLRDRRRARSRRRSVGGVRNHATPPPTMANHGRDIVRAAFEVAYQPAAGSPIDRTGDRQSGRATNEGS